MRSLLHLAVLIVPFFVLIESTHEISVTAQVPSEISMPWVRTVDGWERPITWAQQPIPLPALHPFVVAGVQLLGSVLALVAFSPADLTPGDLVQTWKRMK